MLVHSLYQRLLFATYTQLLVLISLSMTVCCSSKDASTGDIALPPSGGGTTIDSAALKLFTLDTFLVNPTASYTDEQLLDSLQRGSIVYFWEYAHPTSKMARERYHTDDASKDQDIVTMGGSGFSMLSILAGIHRGFISRAEGLQHLQKMVDFLAIADRFHGVWSHWLNGKTGKKIAFSTKDDGGDLVETSLMCMGLICVREYFKEGTAEEKALAAKCDELWRGVEFSWYTKEGSESVLYWHWSPNYKWAINLKLQGYNESLLAYVLGASSPTHPIRAGVYDSGWAQQGAIKSTAQMYTIPIVLNHSNAYNSVGPLFFSQYSFLGLNPTGLTDAYADYEALTTNHAKIYVEYSIQNPKRWKGYGANCWGLTAGYSRKADGTMDYLDHQIAQNKDRGVINPTAALSCFPYTPKESMQFLRFIYGTWGKGLVGAAGPYDAFSPHYMWVAPRYLAIDQGTIAPMVENYRTGLLWDLFMNAPEIQAGLKKLKFHSTKYNF